MSSECFFHATMLGNGNARIIQACPHRHRLLVWGSMLSSLSALENERYYGLGMDALVTMCSWKRSRIVDAFDNG